MTRSAEPGPIRRCRSSSISRIDQPRAVRNVTAKTHRRLAEPRTFDALFDTTRVEYGSDVVDLPGHYSNLTGQLARLEQLTATMRLLM